MRHSGGISESARIRQLREAINANNIAFALRNRNVPATCVTPIISPNQTTQNESTHTLYRAIECPIVYTQPNAPCTAQPVFTPSIPYLPTATEGPQGPGVAIVERQFVRINSIDEISKPVTHKSCSSKTALIRMGIENASMNNRYPQTNLPVILYKPLAPSLPSPNFGGSASKIICPLPTGTRVVG